MKAEVPIVVEHPDDDVQTAFCPWLPWAAAGTENNPLRRITIADTIQPEADDLGMRFAFVPTNKTLPKRSLSGAP